MKKTSDWRARPHKDIRVNTFVTVTGTYAIVISGTATFTGIELDREEVMGLRDAMKAFLKETAAMEEAVKGPAVEVAR